MVNVLVLLLGIVGSVVCGEYAPNGLVVKAPSGTYIGVVTGTTPNVRQFRSIPYAAPPVGSLRWLPPVKPSTNCSNVIDATSFPPSCPQFIQSAPSIFNQDVPEYLINLGSQNASAGESAEQTSEDCLKLAVWAPLESSDEKLPVIVFNTGGGFTVGGIDIKAQLPHRWVERTQSHIVVTTNYRLNILGFPNAAGLTSLESQNLGILDQRMALEWVHDNIAAFGGDPEKITLWGQSAGAESADLHNFAYASNPIASSYYMSSGTAFLGLSSPDPTYSNFSFVASQLGCGSLPPDDELTCMRTIPFHTLQNFLGNYATTNSPLRFSQTPVIPDDVIFFQNYTARYLAGSYSKSPALISHTANEGAVLPPFPPTNASLVDLGTRLFLCGAAGTSTLRTQTGSITYRFEFAGNFSNVSPAPYLGAFHDSDLPYVFGTYEELRGEPTMQEREVSSAMQDRVLAFMRDPVDGVRREFGWERYGEGKMVVFGRGEEVVEEVDVESVEGICAGGGIGGFGR